MKRSPEGRAEITARLSKAVQEAGGCQPVADGIGTSYQAIHWWVTGKNIPGSLSLGRFCRAFGVSADWILLGKRA